VTKGAPRRDHAQEKTPGAHIKLSYHIYIGGVDKRWHDPRDHRSHLADPAMSQRIEDLGHHLGLGAFSAGGDGGSRRPDIPSNRATL
jgi:hypothetical protein